LRRTLAASSNQLLTMPKAVTRQFWLVGSARCAYRMQQRGVPTISTHLKAQAPRTAVFFLLLAVLAGAGCVSQKKAREEAHQAYVAGQEQAMQAAMRARQEKGPVVMVQGQVLHSAVPWQEGMKLSQAIVTAEYTGFMNPRLIRVMRSGQVEGEFKGIDLLHHQDMDLEDGDTVLILP